jgi:hypothetical protein
MIRVNRLPKLRSLGKVYRQAGRQTRKCWVAYQAIVSLTARLSAFCHMQVFENIRKDTAIFFADFLSLYFQEIFYSSSFQDPEAIYVETYNDFDNGCLQFHFFQFIFTNSGKL